ncbi:MAG: FAD-binding oxidoreductase [Fidelibacterota bacterium]|nr:MAG: FAD-binding oxidoreductase [Candidatus Neomarinimicrobiota bacterium]
MNTIPEAASYTWPEHGSALQPSERHVVGTLISQANTARKSIGSPGANYHWDFALLDKIISFRAQDMAISVEVGLTLDKLKTLVENEKLWLPLDTPQGGDILLADYLAHDHSLSWLSHHHGTLHDWAMGLTAVDNNGHEVNSGALVLKNVAGYQLAPLYIGARMALGPVLEVSFRLLPMPTPVTLVHWRADDPSTLMAACQHVTQQCYPSGRGDPWEGFRITRLDSQWRVDGWTLFPSGQVTEWTQKFKSLTSESITESEIPPREKQIACHQPELLIQVRPTQVPELLVTLHSFKMDLICYPKAGAILLGPVDPTGIEVLQREILNPIAAKDGLVKVMTAEGSIDILNATKASAESAIMARVKSILDPEGVFGPLPEIL